MFYDLREKHVTPIEYYQKLIEGEQIIRDEQQAIVIERLQVIYDHLLLASTNNGLLHKLKGKKNIQGLYLWGEVGIGKTFLLDSFYYCLPFKKKMRIHFHEFMKKMHEQLKLFQGEPHPLQKIAKLLSKETIVICFDELIVHDIADAMLLANLFDALYKEKICLLFTSNSAPDNLYLKGIQRDSFLPAIDLIKKNSMVVHVSSAKDYRYRNYQEDKFYFTPLNSETNEKLTSLFIKLRDNFSDEESTHITILNRNIKVKRMADKVIWFDFLDICGVPRSQQDYIEIAKSYDTIFVSNVTAIQSEQNDLIRAFINLVDVFYDTHKRLIISAEKSIEEIYISGRMLFEFARTRSRLVEMQTYSWQEKSSKINS